MVDANVIAGKLRELELRCSKVRRHNPTKAEDLEADGDTFDLVSFNLMLSVQACLDIASHLIADEGWAPATSLGESFRRLAEHGVISPATAAALVQATGLRNLVAHGYGDVKPLLVHAAATAGLADLESFSAEVSAWVRQHS